MAEVSPVGLSLIKRFEGVRLIAYPDVGGVWTIGWGHTGPDVVRGMEITQEEADALLVKDVSKFARGVEKLLSRSATQGQFDALISLAYNIGLGAFKDSTVLKRFNAGQIPGAAEAFILWVRAKGMIYEGLVKRRAAEIVRFMT